MKSSRNRLLAVLCGLSVLSPAMAHQAGKIKERKMPGVYQSYQIKENIFRCEIPVSWRQMRDEREDARQKVYGLYLIGPAVKEGVAARIGLRYFAPGNTLFAGADAYLKNQMAPSSVSLPGEKTGAVEPTNIGTRSARRFVRDTFEYFPPHSRDIKEVPVREEHIVVQQGKGFYVLSFSAPRSMYQRQRPVFQHILDTFDTFRENLP